ncbi:MAG TPA: hypothetical protein VHC63_00370 [Acidimicrobiales bacterium]|nr:hypothetical protein [Acidimicrobiales bacterium]
MRTQERGQVVPLMAAFVVFAGLVIIALAHLGGGAVDRAEAKRAADIAALAGAVDGQRAAEDYATRNGATLSHFDQSGDDATVEVHYGDARATSKAHRDGRAGTPRPGDPAPALRAALARAAQVLGHPPGVVSAHGYTAQFTPAGYAELSPRAADAGLCPSGDNEMKVCGAT